MSSVRSISLVLGASYFAVAVCLSPASADDDGVPMGPTMCLYGYNDYRQCEPGSDSSPAMSVPEPPRDPMLDYTPRYNAALSQLQRLVGGLDELAAMPPETEDELSSRLSALYVSGAYRLDSVNAVRAHNAAVAARTAQMSEDIAAMEASITDAAKRKERDIQRYQAWVASGKLADHRRLKVFEAAFDGRTRLLSDRADQSAQRIVEWLWVAGVPAAQRSPRNLERARPETYLAMADEEKSNTPIRAFRPQVPIVTHGVAFRAPPSGSVDQMLDAVERLVPQIEAATSALEREQPSAAAAEASAAALEIKMRTIQSLYNRADDEAAAAEFRADAASKNFDATRRRAVAAAQNLAVQALETWAVTGVEKKVKDAVKEYVRINGTAAELAALTDANVANLYRASRTALYLAPNTAIRGMDKFLAIQRETLDVMKNPFKHAVAAANALGSGDQVGSDEAVAAFRGLSRDSLTFVEKASKSLPNGVREKALAMIDAVD